MLMRLVVLVLSALLLGGCSWFKGDPKPGDPAELVDFEPTLNVDRVWSTGMGDGINKSAQNLRPVYRDGNLYVADYKGLLASVDAASGDKNWQLKTELPFSGGPGMGNGRVLVGTEDGEIHAFQSETGTPLWIARVSSEILAAPAEQDGIVVVRAIDGRVFGLNAENGRRLWVYDRSVPLLTLRGNSDPLIRAGIVYLGYDGGDVVALRVNDGVLLWEQSIATPEGRTELDRLADVDGKMMFIASDLLVASYKNRLSSLAGDSGRLLWFKDVSSASGLIVDRTLLATTDADDHVWLLDRRNGATQWKLDQLENRGLTRPAIFGSFVVVGDFEGYLHFINAETGEFAAREKVGGKGFTSAPLVIGDRMYVYTRKGELAAYRAGGQL